MTSSSYAYIYEASPYGIKSVQKDSTPAISYSYNTFGLVQSITHNGHQLNYQYDTAGRVSATGIDSGNYSLNKYYKDRLEKVQTDGSLTINNSAAANAVFNYNPDGTLESVTYPNNGSNIIKTSYVYNGLNRLISVTNSKDGTPFSQYTYSYDNNGNITSVTDLNGTTSYEYDVLNRLIEVIKGGATTQEYTYDARGNRENQTGVTAETNGNETLSYNLWNQLVSVADSTGTTTFEYGPTSLRVKKGSKNYIYDVNGNLKAEADASNNITATYIWGGNRLLVKKLADGTQYYYLYNGHGDVVQITDNAGNIVNSYEYDEWGNITSQTETIANEFKYAGQIYDSETGLYYLRARYYDPSTGRFISKDSNEGSIVNPLSLNLYTYCVNNPIIFVDPSGNIYIFSEPIINTEQQLKATLEFFKPDEIDFAYWQAGGNPGYDVVTGVGGYVLRRAGKIVKLTEPVLKAVKGAGKTYANFAKQATKNANSTEVVLGKYIPGGASYTEVAKQRGATYFQLDNWDNVVKEVGENNIWEINESFIRQQASANKTFILSHDPAQATGYFAKEVNLLKSMGYSFTQEGSVWRAVK